MNSADQILITGGTGFVGSHLVEALVKKISAENIHVTTFSHKSDFVTHLLPASSIHQLDLTDHLQTEELLNKIRPSHLIQLAAYAAVGESFEKTAEVLENNLKLQLSLLAAIKSVSPTTRVLSVGSAMEYDFVTTPPDRVDESQPLGPVSPYAVSKTFQDLLAFSYAHSYQLDIVRARPFNHIGERQNHHFAISSFAKQIVEIERGQKTEMTVGNLEAVRDFTDVKDMVQAYLILLDKGATGQVYNIGSDRGYQIKDVLDKLIAMAQTTILVKTADSQLRPLDVPKVIADSSKIRALGWEPSISLDETLARILAYWRSL